ncbi:MAG: protoheme IX farnesyltransferase [Gammaproteobacteria bacterium]|nr:protoheme IX farnesyltransferase [Gammaproteobacteria bacterium]
MIFSLQQTIVARTQAKHYFEVCKPKVVAVMLFTTLVGMLIAAPLTLSFSTMVAAMTGIALVSGAAAAINHVADHRIDALMQRTKDRPLPTGTLSSHEVLVFAATIGTIGTLILVLWVNILTAVLTLLSLVGYAVVYTRFLKYATPQNIVIGGAAGATPPMLGWTAATGQLEFGAFLLFLIIFVWTPPHFWALAMYRKEEYAKAGVPMLPVTHGEDFTRLQILLYIILLTLVTILPYATALSGPVYLFAAVALNAVFIYYGVALRISRSPKKAMETFGFSIIYLMLLFAALLVDRYIGLLI